MRLLIYQANSLTTNIEIIGNLVVSNNRYYIIPVNTDMIVHNNYSINNIMYLSRVWRLINQLLNLSVRIILNYEL